MPNGPATRTICCAVAAAAGAVDRRTGHLPGAVRCGVPPGGGHRDAVPAAGQDPGRPPPAHIRSGVDVGGQLLLVPSRPGRCRPLPRRAEGPAGAARRPGGGCRIPGVVRPQLVAAGADPLAGARGGRLRHRHARRPAGKHSRRRSRAPRRPARTPDQRPDGRHRPRTPRRHGPGRGGRAEGAVPDPRRRLRGGAGGRRRHAGAGEPRPRSGCRRGRGARAPPAPGDQPGGGGGVAAGGRLAAAYRALRRGCGPA